MNQKRRPTLNDFPSFKLRQRALVEEHGAYDSIEEWEAEQPTKSDRSFTKEELRLRKKLSDTGEVPYIPDDITIENILEDYVNE